MADILRFPTQNEELINQKVVEGAKKYSWGQSKEDNIEKALQDYCSKLTW